MNNLCAIMAEEARSPGAITFARFMELALYCPNFGYYERPQTTVGRSGDFFTSVSVGSLFGELLGFQFAQWLDSLLSSAPERRRPLQIVETGAHDGQLARDILAWLRSNRPKLLKSLEYWIIEPSVSRTQMQRKALGDLDVPLLWFSSLSAIPSSGVHGVIFSNELLDSMPVHRIGWDAAKQQWFEWGVAPIDDQYGVPPSGGKVPASAATLPNVQSSNSLSPSQREKAGVRGPIPATSLQLAPGPSNSLSPSEGERAGVRGPIILGTQQSKTSTSDHSDPAATAPPLFTWTKLPADPSLLRKGGLSDLPNELLAVLPDGFTTEIGLAAIDWWHDASAALRSGKVLTIDYGFTADDFLLPERREGTLRGYRRHQMTPDLLAFPGEQDLTAHINFTAIQNAGEARGLRTEVFQSQAQFLTAILQRIDRDHSAFGEWTSKHARQFQTLTHPSHLGRPFKVLVQSR